MAEEVSKQALAVFSTISKVLEKEEFNFQKDEEKLEFRFGARGNDLPVDIIITVIPGRDLITFLSFLPFKGVGEKMTDIAMAICEINFKITAGCFSMSLKNGAIAFQISQSFKGSLISEELIKDILYTTFFTVDEYNDKLFDVSRGKLAASDILAE